MPLCLHILRWACTHFMFWRQARELFWHFTLQSSTAIMPNKRSEWYKQFHNLFIKICLRIYPNVWIKKNPICRSYYTAGRFVWCDSLKFQQFYLMNFTFQLWPKILLKLVIFPLWKNYEILKMNSVTWSWKDKGRASSWKSHALFSWGYFTR